MRVRSIHDVTPDLLAELGLRALLVDVDDTLLCAAATDLATDVRDWFKGLEDAGVRMAILSNGSKERVANVAREVGVPALSMAGKPFKWAFKRGLKLLGNAEPAETGMVGDQLFTDVLGAKIAGLTTILVEPLSPGKLPHTRLARQLERWVLKER